MAKASKDNVLDDIEKEKRDCKDEAELKQYSELQDIIKQIDLSILGSGSGQVVPSSSKRRKTSSSKKSEDQSMQKDFIKTVKQIELVKKALATIYDMENARFTKFISRHGDKRNNIVSRADFMERIIDNGRSVPLWLGMPDESPPELCGANAAGPNYIAKPGDLVAALVSNDDTENNWILAEVTGYNCKTRDYTVVDIYEDLKLEYTLSKEKIIPLPKMRADPEINPEALFPERALVLALFPRTTCFYRAVVSKRPTGPDDPYQLLFEDASCPSGYSSATEVHQRYVIICKGERDSDSGDGDVEIESEKDE